MNARSNCGRLKVPPDTGSRNTGWAKDKDWSKHVPTSQDGNKMVLSQVKRKRRSEKLIEQARSWPEPNIKSSC